MTGLPQAHPKVIQGIVHEAELLLAQDGVNPLDAPYKHETCDSSWICTTHDQNKKTPIFRKDITKNDYARQPSPNQYKYVLGEELDQSSPLGELHNLHSPLLHTSPLPEMMVQLEVDALPVQSEHGPDSG